MTKQSDMSLSQVTGHHQISLATLGWASLSELHVPTALMANIPEFEKAAIEVHEDGSKELDAGLRPLDHYKQVQNPSCPPPG